MTSHRQSTRVRGPAALAWLLCTAIAAGQDAASANYKCDLVDMVGGGGVMASGTRNAVISVEAVSGSMAGVNFAAEIGLIGGVGISPFGGPQILDVSPHIGSCFGGDLVRIRGLNFNQGGGGPQVTVRVGSAPAFAPSSVSDQEIFFTTPPGNGGAADVRVTTPYGTLVLASAFEYICPGGPPVTIFEITPKTGDMDGNTLVTLSGLSFVSGSVVLFDGSPATNVVIVNSNTLTCRTPPHAPGFATPTVVNLQGVASLPLGFEYRALAKVVNLGGGCAGTSGFPQNFVGGGLPVVGGPPFNAVLANAYPNAIASLIVGDEFPGGWVIEGTSCLAFIDPSYFFLESLVTSAFGTGFFTFQIPNDPAFAGLTVTVQWVVLDPGGALNAFSMSNALRVRLGY